MPSRVLQKPDPQATGSQPTYPLPGSVWAATVPGTPTVKQRSSTIVSNLLTQGFGAGGNPAKFFVGANDGTPRYLVHGQAIAGSFGLTTIRIFNPQTPGNPQGTMTWPLPLGWVTSTGTDSQITVWDLDNSTLGTYTGPIIYNGWSFQRNTNTHYPGQCFVQQRCPTNGSYSGFGAWSQDPLTTGTTTASGAPYIATNITYAEFLWGTLNHVLALTIANPTAEYYSPAVASDGTTALASGGVPYGTWFYLPASVPEPNWATTGCTAPALAHQVFVALKTYGMVAVDQTAGQGCDLGIEAYGPWARWNPRMVFDGVSWPVNLSTAYNSFLGMPWSSLQVFVPSSQLGSGGGGSSALRANGSGQGLATLTPGTITIPSAVQTGDTLVLFTTFVGQGWNSGTPSGWTLLGSGDKAGTNFAVFTKTAAPGDAGSNISMGFAGSALAWDIVAVSGSTGATLSQVYQDFGFLGTRPATLSGGQNLTLLYVTCSNSVTPRYWPDGYTQTNWQAATQRSTGLGYFSGAAYGNDAFVPSSTSVDACGLQVAV